MAALLGGLARGVGSNKPTSLLGMSYMLWQQTRNATKKAGGSTKNGRDSPGQRLGVKKFGGEAVLPGNIIIRQRGRKVWCGEHVKMGRDHTIYAIKEGWVKFKYDQFRKHQVVSIADKNPNLAQIKQT